jgi:hypothetical protein
MKIRLMLRIRAKNFLGKATRNMPNAANIPTSQNLGLVIVFCIYGGRISLQRKSHFAPIFIGQYDTFWYHR